jgi:hypothetical protein
LRNNEIRKSTGEMSRVTLERTDDEQGQVWVVERVGVEALTFRLAQQAQWEQADAVSDGRHPRIDPDGMDLEEIDEGVRIYRSHEVPGTMDGRPAILSQRLVKRLANGIWENDVDVEAYRYPDEPRRR